MPRSGAYEARGHGGAASHWGRGARSRHAARAGLRIAALITLRPPPPLEGGGWGEGLVGDSHRPTPPLGPLPQGEGEDYLPPRAACSAFSIGITSAAIFSNTGNCS